MCGIVGYIGQQDAVPILMDCLKRLEYRGYDSAGIGAIEDGRLEIRRSEGKIVNLERLLQKDPIRGQVGVAHTRWATHGKPSNENAHPHRDCTGSVAVVHNGIIENHFALKKALQAEGHRFESETDTEVVAHLIEQGVAQGFESATRKALTQIKGAYALGIISQTAPEQLLAVRNGGPPLVVGIGKDGFFIASDIAAILNHTREVLVLENREIAIVSKDAARIVSFDGLAVQKTVTRVSWDAAAAEKNGLPHFMLKEIYEQPRTIEDTIRDVVHDGTGEVCFPEVDLTRSELERITRVFLIACGTSWHAALVGKYVLEALCRIPVEVDVASEFRYRSPVVDQTTLTIAISQSGETADTLGALREAKGRGSKTLAICNVVGSSMSREAEGVIYTRAGIEVAVASTKTFTSQLVALYLFAINLGQARGSISFRRARGLLKELMEVPQLAEKILVRNPQLVELARRLCDYSNFLYLGRGINYPLALEGALKLKEISYIHAEGYPAGEMKHGPIALIDGRMPVVVIAPQGYLYEKMVGNIEEVKARNGMVIALVSEGDEEIAAKADHVFDLPRISELLLPILLALPLQLLAHHIAVLRNCDVDQPRNLAKSVTVE
jgi:glucosamine--fructose-6-phosphate aminotransferase (isomerizing)